MFPPDARGMPVRAGFGQFRLLEELSCEEDCATMYGAELWRAYDTATGRAVALTVLPPHYQSCAQASPMAGSDTRSSANTLAVHRSITSHDRRQRRRRSVRKNAV